MINILKYYNKAKKIKQGRDILLNRYTEFSHHTVYPRMLQSEGTIVLFSPFLRLKTRERLHSLGWRSTTVEGNNPSDWAEVWTY